MSLFHHHRHYLIRPHRGFPWVLATFLGLGLIGFEFAHPWVTLTAVAVFLCTVWRNGGRR